MKGLGVAIARALVVADDVLGAIEILGSPAQAEKIMEVMMGHHDQSSKKCDGKIMGKYGNIGKRNKETRDPVLFFVLACIISTTEWSAMEYTIDNPRSGLAGMATGD